MEELEQLQELELDQMLIILLDLLVEQAQDPMLTVMEGPLVGPLTVQEGPLAEEQELHQM